MRVAIYGMHYAPEPSGNAPFTTSLAESLAARGHEVFVITGTPHYPEWRVFEGHGRWSSRSREGGVEVTRLRHPVYRKPTLTKRSLMELAYGARLLSRRLPNVDVAICVSPALLGTALLAEVWRLNDYVPTVLWIQDLYSRGLSETQGAGVAVSITSRIERRVARGFSTVVVAHDRFQERLADDFGVPRERVHVIRNWTRLPKPSGSAAETRQTLGWGSKTVCLHAGNMGIKQGLENIIDAARIARRTHPHLHFVLLGNGNQEHRLRQLSAGLPNLEFIGSLPDDRFHGALASADLLLLNELRGVMEMSIPSKLTSYFASGRPVLAAVAPGSVTEEEVLRSGAGVCVASGDPDALVGQAARLASRPAWADALGRKGQEYASRELTHAGAIDRFEALLSEAIFSRGHRG